MSARDKLTASHVLSLGPPPSWREPDTARGYLDNPTSAYCGPQLQYITPRYCIPQVQPYKRGDRCKCSIYSMHYNTSIHPVHRFMQYHRAVKRAVISLKVRKFHWSFSSYESQDRLCGALDMCHIQSSCFHLRKNTGYWVTKSWRQNDHM